MTRCTCKILAQIGLSFLVLSAALADDDPNATTRPAHTGTRSVGGGGGGGGFSAGFGGNGSSGFTYTTRTGNLTLNTSAIGSAERAAIITTAVMDAQTQTQLKEDLNIMDKLLRDSLAGFSGGAVPNAMGIHLMMLGNTSPMYVEGAGAVFSTSFHLPIAATTQPDAKADNKPADSGSLWDRAKNEIEQVQGSNNTRTVVITGAITVDSAKREPVKVDDVCDAVLKVLPEAKNIRSLKPDESVIVTISAFDESGAPVRLTLKAKKADIDDAGDGRMKPEEFKLRVLRRVG